MLRGDQYHIQTLDPAVIDALHLKDADVAEMITLIHHRLSTIYSESHALAIGSDQLFNTMRTSIATKFGEEFLHVGKSSINQQLKAAIARISMGNETLRRSMLSGFAAFVIRPQDTDDDFADVSSNHPNCGRFVTNRATDRSRGLCRVA